MPSAFKFATMLFDCRLIDWIKSDTGFDRELALRNFYLYFSENDKRRGTKFISTFVQLETIWEECKEKYV